MEVHSATGRLIALTVGGPEGVRAYGSPLRLLVGPFEHPKVQIGLAPSIVKSASHSRPFDLGIGICCRCTKKTATLTVLQGFPGLIIALTACEGMVAAVLTVLIRVPSLPILRIANPRAKLGPMLGHVGPARSGGSWSALLGMASRGWAWQGPPEGSGAAHRGSNRRGINHWPRRGPDRGSSSIWHWTTGHTGHSAASRVKTQERSILLTLDSLCGYWLV